MYGPVVKHDYETVFYSWSEPYSDNLIYDWSYLTQWSPSGDPSFP